MFVISGRKPFREVSLIIRQLLACWAGLAVLGLLLDLLAGLPVARHLTARLDVAKVTSSALASYFLLAAGYLGLRTVIHVSRPRIAVAHTRPIGH
jgi:hypothetical protein